jgi:hypothetical protein
MNKDLTICMNKNLQQWLSHNKYGMFYPAPQLHELPLGSVEPQELLLEQPKILIYKFIKLDYFIQSVNNSYLHFNRINSYKDFDNPDVDDGDQLPKDREIHSQANFIKSPSYNLENYYDDARSKSYACCFTTRKNKGMFAKYGNICVVFEFGKLRKALNKIIDFSYLVQNDNLYLPIFDINYGHVQYCDRQQDSICGANPLKYLYLRDGKYKNEHELRVSLSAITGKFHKIIFTESLRLQFDFQEAIDRQIIQKIICDKDTASKLPEFRNFKPTLLNNNSQKSNKSIS